jgi:hypothetical protein
MTHASINTGGSWVSAGGSTVPVHIVLGYDSRDPYAITATITADGSAPVPWMFARDLLREAIARTPQWVGNGDVQARMVGEAFWLVLHSPDGHADLVLRPQPIAQILHASLGICPIGHESEHVMAELDQVLAGGAS